MKQKPITRLDHCQYLRVTQVNYPLSYYAKPHLTQNLVAKNLVAQISDNRIYNVSIRPYPIAEASKHEVANHQ